MKIGLLAGYGKMVDIVLRELKKEGHEVVLIDIMVDGLSKESYAQFYFSMGDSIESLFSFFRENDINHIAFAGKVDKNKIIERFSSSLNGDYRNVDRGDLSLLTIFQALLRGYGINVVNMVKYLEKYITEEKLYTKLPLTDEERADVYFGAKRAKILADMEIGQTIVLKDKMVYAVEAIGGTNECIRRAGRFGAREGIVVKVGRSSQKFDMEIPVIGLETIRVALESGMRVIAIEAGKTLFIERDKALSLADKMGIKIVGFSLKGES